MKDDTIEDLKDEIHDLGIEIRELKQELRDAERENAALQAEVDDSVAREEAADSEREAAVKKSIEVKEQINRDADEIKSKYDTLCQKHNDKQFNYIKALSIAESLHANGSGYFHTPDGKKLLDWALNQLKREAACILKSY